MEGCARATKQKGLVSPHRGVLSIGSIGDRFFGSPHSWLGPESTLLGSPFQAPSMSTIKSMVGQGIRNACTYPKTKIFPKHWSLQEVRMTMEARSSHFNFHIFFVFSKVLGCCMFSQGCNHVQNYLYF